MDPEQKYIVFLEEWAKKQKCVFEIDTFVGRESSELINGMLPDDVWGWLIPDGITEKRDEFYGCAEWRAENGNLVIEWNTYDFFVDYLD